MFPRVDKGTIEYRLTIQQALNKEKKRHCIRFTFQTTEEFTYFRYGITIDHELKKKEIHFYLRGLKTLGLTVPESGAAQSSLDLFDLGGEYKVTIHKQGASRNDFSIKISPAALKLLRDVHDKTPFIELDVPTNSNHA